MTLERMAHGLKHLGRVHTKADTRSFWELLTKLYRQKVNAIFTGQLRSHEVRVDHAYVHSLQQPLDTR